MVTLASMFEKTSRWQGQKQKGQLRDNSNNPGPRWCLDQDGEWGKKWFNSKCILKGEATGFVDRACEKGG